MANTPAHACPLAKKCGGCQLQNLSYDEQLHLKQATAIRLLGRFGHVEEIIGMEDPYHYRNKVQAAFGVNRQGQIISGVYQSASHRIVPVSDCMIEDTVADQIIVTIRGLLKSFKIRPYDEDTGRDKAAGTLGIRQGEDLVHCAAQLERARALHALGLDVHLAAEGVIERRQTQQRRGHNIRGDARMRRPNGFQCHTHGGTLLSDFLIVTHTARVVKPKLSAAALDNPGRRGHNQKKFFANFRIQEKSHVKHADKSKRTRNLCNAAMLCCAAAVLLTGLGRTLLRPKDVNYYENRPANTVAPLTAESWLDGSFQDAMEAALSDQIPLAQAMKKTFNDAQNKIRYDSMMRLSRRYPNVPVQYDQFLVYGGKYLAYAYRSPDMVIPELTRHSENLNALIAAHPDVTFYLYMVEGDTNNNFQAGENNGAFEYLSSQVNLPAEQMGRFAADDLATFERDFYQTDHHWNNVGSYRGYREAAALLGCTDLLEPLETVRVSDHFSGSKALSIGAQEQFFEPMDVYRFAFPKMSVTIAGEPADDYGWQDAALSGQLTDANYGGVYGWDNGEVILDTGTTGRGNLLMLGESYDNAILKLMASHFDRVYSVDLRSYEQDMGKPFRLAEYLREHEITKVLLIGSTTFFTSDDFMVED